VLTTHAAPEQAILDGIAIVPDQAGLTPGDLGIVIHDTTLAATALIERRGAKVAFVTTVGFRDVIEMRAESRFDQYGLNLTLPATLVPREDRFTVAGRVGAGAGLLPAGRQAACGDRCRSAAGQDRSREFCGRGHSAVA
jgi:N-methylhydantoinase A